MQDKTPTVSVDFDGCILKLVLGRVWRRQPFKREHPSLAPFFAPIERLWSYFSLLFRRPIPGSIAALTDLHSLPLRLFLLTSRTANDYPACHFFLKIHHLLPVFRYLFHNSKSSPSRYFKYHTIVSQKIDIHIDDDPYFLSYLAKKLPNNKFIHLCFYGQQSPKIKNVITCHSWSEIVTYLTNSIPTGQ